MPVTPDIDDAELERLAEGKGVGSLVKPTANRNRAGEAKPEASPAAVQAAPPAPDDDKPMLPGATPRSRMKTVNLELPDYVWTDLKIRAAHAQSSVRHIVMAALKGYGVEIHDVDMIEDGRRLRT
jgi:plasmid stability protein